MRGMRYLPLVLILAATGAHAQYKCVARDGAVSIQQAPCATGQRAERLALPAPQPPDGRDHIRQAIAEGRVAIGMTREEVDRAARGQPYRVHTSTREGAQRQQLVYKSPAGKPRYVYLRDGVVTSFSGEED